MSNPINDLARVGTRGQKWNASVSAVQHTAITRALSGAKLEASDSILDYVTSGDLSCLTSDEATAIRKVVKQAKEGLTESQAKRIWPRKVAAVLIAS